MLVYFNQHGFLMAPKIRLVGDGKPERGDMFRSAGTKYLSPEKRHPSPLKLDTNGYWSDMLKRQFTFAKVRIMEPQAFSLTFCSTAILLVPGHHHNFVLSQVLHLH